MIPVPFIPPPYPPLAPPLSAYVERRYGPMEFHARRAALGLFCQDDVFVEWAMVRMAQALSCAETAGAC